MQNVLANNSRKSFILIENTFFTHKSEIWCISKILEYFRKREEHLNKIIAGAIMFILKFDFD